MRIGSLSGHSYRVYGCRGCGTSLTCWRLLAFGLATGTGSMTACVLMDRHPATQAWNTMLSNRWIRVVIAFPIPGLLSWRPEGSDRTYARVSCGVGTSQERRRVTTAQPVRTLDMHPYLHADQT